MRFILLSLSLTLLLVGCKDRSPAATDAAAPSPEAAAQEAPEVAATIAEITVEDADQAIQTGAVPVDANSMSTRKKHGMVPDAVMLTSSSKYDLTQLPEDKSKDLIFYCSNTYCTASDSAAERAQANGYENVHIMREGIKGWIEAGKPTKTFTDS